MKTGSVGTSPVNARMLRGRAAGGDIAVPAVGKAPVACGALRLLAGVSFSALMLGLSITPASAQLARLRATAGAQTAVAVAAGTTAAPIRPVTRVEAVQRQQAMQSQAQQLSSYVKSAQGAARASLGTVPGASQVTDGISTNGLNPIAAVRNVTLFVAAGQSNVTANAAPSSVAAANDSTGLNTWDGATAPIQTVANGTTTVTITQTQNNALLSWQNFDVGANTSLVFSQKQNGVAQSGWTVVNRVVNATNPSKILGSITADGTVLILNGSGVLFGPHAQVSLNSLIASSLELGNFASAVTSIGQTQYFVASTIKDRNWCYDP